ncbi:hypothetical protein EDB85DRAFT_2007483, partial [Lactarius pseudohatsudake]
PPTAFIPRGCMRAPSPPGLPLTRVYAGHIVVAVSLAALGPTQMSSFFSLFIFFSYSFRLGRASHSRDFAAASHPHPLPLDRDPATSLRLRHPGSTDPATTRTPRRHLDTVATVTSTTIPSAPPSSTPLHRRRLDTASTATSTVIATRLVHPTPPHRRRFDTAHHWHRDAGTAVVHSTPPHGAVSTRPPAPPDSTCHTGTAATATSLLHLSPPHLYY